MSHSYFENRECEYYPCHGLDAVNCLFCFCPLYSIADCGGNPKYIKDSNGEQIKDCSDCVYPHIKENYDKIIERLSR